MSHPVFTEAELDAAAEEMAKGAIYECPSRIYDHLSEEQAKGLRADLCEFVKTSLLFDPMNYLEPDA